MYEELIRSLLCHQSKEGKSCLSCSCQQQLFCDTRHDTEAAYALEALINQLTALQAENAALRKEIERLQDPCGFIELLREELQAYRAIGPVEELSALVKARGEGRVVALDTPRKPLVWGDDDHETCLCPDCGADLMGIPYGEQHMVLQCPACGQYLDATKAITRAEAEAALQKGGPHEADLV